MQRYVLVFCISYIGYLDILQKHVQIMSSSYIFYIDYLKEVYS